MSDDKLLTADGTDVVACGGSRARRRAVLALAPGAGAGA